MSATSFGGLGGGILGIGGESASLNTEYVMSGLILRFFFPSLARMIVGPNNEGTLTGLLLALVVFFMVVCITGIFVGQFVGKSNSKLFLLEAKLLVLLLKELDTLPPNCWLRSAFGEFGGLHSIKLSS